MERFWSKVHKLPGDGCWVWTGATVEGYGQFKGDTYGFTSKRAHRISWEMAHGAIPPGLHVCHRCDNPPCVRPDHLFLGTQTDNMRDMHAKGRSVVPNKGVCRLGHSLDGDNVRSNGKKRQCRACARKREMRRYYQNREAMCAKRRTTDVTLNRKGRAEKMLAAIGDAERLRAYLGEPTGGPTLQMVRA